jgi:exodeoxyribonuclease-3
MLHFALMRLLAWNVQNGGCQKADGIYDAVLAHDTDIAVLTEVRSCTEEMLSRFEQNDWHLLRGQRTGRQGGIAIVSKTRLISKPLCHAPSDPRHRRRYLDVQVPVNGLHITAVYGPTEWADVKTQDERQAFWSWFTQSCVMCEPRVLIGDFNIGLAADCEGKMLSCSAKFGELLDGNCGWTDVWRSQNKKAEYTWYSPKGNGFRIDHAIASPALLPYVPKGGCRYSHDEREAGISDHSILLLDVEMPQGVSEPEFVSA